MRTRRDREHLRETGKGLAGDIVVAADDSRFCQASDFHAVIFDGRAALARVGEERRTIDDLDVEGRETLATIIFPLDEADLADL